MYVDLCPQVPLTQTEGIVMRADRTLSLDCLYKAYAAEKSKKSTTHLCASLKEGIDPDAHPTAAAARAATFEKGSEQVPTSLLRDHISPAHRQRSAAFTSIRTFASQLGLHFAMQLLTLGRAATASDLIVKLDGRIEPRASVTYVDDYTLDCIKGIDESVQRHESAKKSLAAAGSATEGAPSAPASAPAPQEDNTKESEAAANTIPPAKPDLNALLVDVMKNATTSYAASSASGEDILNHSHLPFRLTRNVVECLSPLLIMGGTALNLGCVVDAFAECGDVLKAELCFIFFDEIQRRCQAVKDSIYGAQLPAFDILSPFITILAQVGQFSCLHVHTATSRCRRPFMC
jgi:hypothetical protein